MAMMTKEKKKKDDNDGGFDSEDIRWFTFYYGQN